MDAFSVNSSIVLAVTIALWLLWVVPYALRRRHRPIVAQVAVRQATTRQAVASTTDTTARTTADPSGSARTTNQGTTMLKLRDGSFGSYRGGRGASAVTPATATGLRIHWDRMALAAAGVIALLAALVTGVVALVTTLPLAVPVVLFLLFVGTVVGLRSLAVRDRRRRLDAAFDEVLDARDEHRYVIDDVDRDTLLFDAAAVEDETPTMSADELREAARSLAASTDDGTASEQPAVTAWHPVAVPRPGYVDAQKAERPAPEPLRMPETPRPTTRTSIRASEAGRGGATGAETAPGQLNDLDGVLRRRRGA